MSVGNDSRRADRKTKKVIDPHTLPARLRIPWPQAVELGFATVSFEGHKPAYTAVVHQDIATYPSGVVVSREAFILAMKAAPRAVRRRLGQVT